MTSKIWRPLRLGTPGRKEISIHNFEELAALHTVARILAQPGELRDQIEQALQEMSVRLGMQRGMISLLDRETGAVEYERTRRGWISYFNDLHKGRNAGPAWGWFLDIFAVACLVFCITGLFLLYLHGRQRRMTWPMVGLGLLVPLLIALLFIH